jgi:hypothetical protein
MITSGDCTCMINWECFYISNVFLCSVVLSCNCVYVNVLYICMTNSTSGGLKPIKDLWSDE